MRTLLLLPLVGLVGCASDNTITKSAAAYGVGDASIHGRVCDGTTGTWLEGATVYTHVIDGTGTLLATPTATSDADGWYTLEDLPGGTYQVYVQYGSETVDMFVTTVEDGEDLTLDEASCAGSADTEVAAITGDYDDWDEALPELGLGNVTVIPGETGEELRQFLLAPADMASYDAIFIPGGLMEEDVFYDTDGSDTDGYVSSVRQNLKDYVEAGGVLVASDWGYDAVEQTWSGKIEFLGDDATPDDAQKGEPATEEASVTDKGLADQLGANKAQIVYDLDTWPVIESVVDGVTVYVKGDAPWRDGESTGTETGVPYLVGFDDGSGKVYVSSFRASSNLDGDGKAIFQYLFRDL